MGVIQGRPISLCYDPTTMSPSARDQIKAASRISDADEARKLLAKGLSPAVVRALALRVDELRFHEPWAALAIAEVALEAASSLPSTKYQSTTVGLLWAVYGSACRTVARFKEAELALTVAVGSVPRSRHQARADLAKRWAYLRADEGHSDDVGPLVAAFLGHARRLGPLEVGRQLVDAGAIYFLLEDYPRALAYLQKAIEFIPRNGDSYHLSAIHNLARCRFELSSSRSDLFIALGLSRDAAKLVEAGSYSGLKLRWLDGRLQHRLGQLDESLKLLEGTRQGIDERGDGYDRALLVLDIAELHLDRGDATSAQELARSSFGILSVLRKDHEAYKSMQIFYRAGVKLALDRATVHTVRERMLELQRRPRRSPTNAP